MLATGALVVYVGGAIATVALNVVGHEGIWEGGEMVPFTTFAVVGWIVAVRRPAVPLGWLFIGIGLLAVFGGTNQAIEQAAVARHWSYHGVVMFAGWVQLWFWYPLVTLGSAYTMLLYPNGLLTRRWRPLLAVLTVAISTVTIVAALSPEVQFGRTWVPNPIGLRGLPRDVEESTLFSVMGVLLVGCLVASVFSLGLRYRRFRGAERAQLKWFFFGASLLGLTIGGSIISQSFNNSAAESVLFPTALTCIPLTCGLAVLRYRLYDIDRVVSRTVTYLLVTGLLIGAYVGCVALTTSVLSFGSSLGVAASTLAAAALFQPVRRRVQSVVDRRFNRARYDAVRTVETFASRLRDEVQVAAVRDDLLAVAADAIEPAHLSLWVAP